MPVADVACEGGRELGGGLLCRVKSKEAEVRLLADGRAPQLGMQHAFLT